MAIVGVHHCLGAVILLLVLQIYRINGEAVHLNKENLEEFKRSKKIMLMNFYADWCRYSSALKPIYDKAADQISTETNEAILAKIDCERSKPLCHEFQIIKYPTVKIIRNGELIQKEYRGQRTTEAIVAFVRNQIKNPIQTVSSYSEFVGKVEKNTKAVVGVFVSNETEQYGIFQRVAFKLKDDCKFFAVIDKDQNLASQMSFRDQESPDQQFAGDMLSYDSMHGWLQELCVPLVREITFQNGEELTEEGLPFLILFYHPDHAEIKATFRQKVEEELIDQKGMMNFVTADGIKFGHPLSHIGKSKKDLPVLAIDSFRHMYLFPTFNDIHVPGKLKQFVQDLHSGKLHREFHYGPDQPHAHHQHGGQHGGHQEQKRNEQQQQPQQPPESTFRKLQPGKSRYTFIDHDEL